jgi:hypothetical protein
MSVGSFLSVSLDALQSENYDVSLALACTAIDATAKKLYGDGLSNNQRNKKFLNENMRLVTHFGFPGITASGLAIKCDNIPELKRDPKGLVSMEEILYHTLRCGLVHECEIDNRIEFVEATFIGDYNNKFRMPANLIFGLVLSVVLSESNVGETLSKNYSIKSNGKNYNLNTLWGERAKILREIS